MPNLIELIFDVSSAGFDKFLLGVEIVGLTWVPVGSRSKPR